MTELCFQVESKASGCLSKHHSIMASLLSSEMSYTDRLIYLWNNVGVESGSGFTIYPTSPLPQIHLPRQRAALIIFLVSRIKINRLQHLEQRMIIIITAKIFESCLPSLKEIKQIAIDSRESARQVRCHELHLRLARWNALDELHGWLALPVDRSRWWWW